MLRKIIKSVAIRCQILMHLIIFWLGLRPRPAGELTVRPQTSYLDLRVLFLRKRRGEKSALLLLRIYAHEAWSTGIKFGWLVVKLLLWDCWLGVRPVKNSGRVWHSYLSWAWCRLAYGPADATATYFLTSVKSSVGFTFLYWLTLVVPDKGPWHGCCCGDGGKLMAA